MSGLSMYVIVEASRHMLKLRGRTIGLWLMAAFLVVCGLPLVYFAVFEVGRRHTILRILGGSLGLFFIVCGLAVVRVAWSYAAGIEFDGIKRVARFTETRSPPMEVSFEEIAAVEVTVSDYPTRRRARLPEHRVVLKLINSVEIVLDRSTDAAAMQNLAAQVLEVVSSSRAAFSARNHSKSAKTGSPVPADMPDGITVLQEGSSTIYRWSTLPGSLFWTWFWGLLTVLFAALTAGAVIGTLSELMKESMLSAGLLMALTAAILGSGYWLSRARRRGLLWTITAVITVELANLILGLKFSIVLMGLSILFGLLFGLSVFIFFARCTVQTSSARFEYREHLGTIPLVWRWKNVPADQVVAFEIRDRFSGGGAVRVLTKSRRPFQLMIPQGYGSFSRRDLEWLRERWQRDLGLPVPSV